MTAVTVTVRLEFLTGVTQVAGRLVTVHLDETKRTDDGFIVASQVDAMTDVNGVVVFDLPSKLSYTFRCAEIGWRCTATIPDTDCELHLIADL